MRDVEAGAALAWAGVCFELLGPTQKLWPGRRQPRRVMGLEEESDDSLGGPALQELIP